MCKRFYGKHGTNTLKWLRDLHLSIYGHTGLELAVGEARSDKSACHIQPKHLYDCPDYIFQIARVAKK